MVRLAYLSAFVPPEGVGLIEGTEPDEHDVKRCLLGMIKPYSNPLVLIKKKKPWVRYRDPIGGFFTISHPQKQSAGNSNPSPIRTQRSTRDWKCYLENNPVHVLNL